MNLAMKADDAPVESVLPKRDKNRLSVASPLAQLACLTRASIAGSLLFGTPFLLFRDDNEGLLPDMDRCPNRRRRNGDDDSGFVMLVVTVLPDDAFVLCLQSSGGVPHSLLPPISAG